MPFAPSKLVVPWSAHLRSRLARWSPLLLTFAFAAGSANCGGSGSKKEPCPVIDCAKAPYRNWTLNGGVAPEISHDESAASTQQAITNGQGEVLTPPRISEIGRLMVRVVRLRNGVPVGNSSGVIVGRHTVLTAAHALRDTRTPYDEIQVLIVDDDTGNWVDARPVAYFVHPDYDPDIENTETHVPNDLAMIEVAIDFQEEQDITPMRIGTGFVPTPDSADCPIDVLSMWGYGRGNRGGDPYIRGTQVTPLDSVHEIIESSIMTFLPVADPGDSGGAVIRLDTRHNVYVLVSLISGLVALADGQTRAATAVLTPERLEPLFRLANQWRNANQSIFAGTYPEPSANLPNGTANPAANHYPVDGEGGDASPTVGGNGHNGYFVYPVVDDPYPQPFPPGAGQCG
jgi:hypothetical protein